MDRMIYPRLGGRSEKVPKEIEHKYLISVEDVPNEIIKNVAIRKEIVQGFLNHKDVRIFVREIDDENGEVSFELRDHSGKTLRIIQEKITFKQVEEWKFAFASSARSGEILTNDTTAIRIRIVNEELAFLTVKGKKEGIEAPEFEYRIDLKEAENSMPLCGDRIVEKTRYVTPFKGHKFEIDVFHGENKGLVIVEVEKRSVDEEVELPEFLKNAKDVSEDMKYTNMHLAKKPFKRFRDQKHSSVNLKPSE